MKLKTKVFSNFHDFSVVLLLCALAILAACSSRRLPDCNDPSVISSIERDVNEIVESELSAGITEPKLLASARKVFQLHVDGVRTTSTDVANKKVTCSAILVASLNRSSASVDLQTSLRRLLENLPVADLVQTYSGELRSAIQFSALMPVKLMHCQLA